MANLNPNFPVDLKKPNGDDVKFTETSLPGGAKFRVVDIWGNEVLAGGGTQINGHFRTFEGNEVYITPVAV